MKSCLSNITVFINLIYHLDLPVLPKCIPRARGKYSRAMGIIVLNVLRWSITGKLPQNSKFIIAVAPHTSNWDFVIGMAMMFALNLRVKFMGKKDIFIWPFKSFLEGIGGIAIDRNVKHGVVEQMVEQFNQHEQFILALAPEGTRKKTVQWKSGFLHIAQKANVPVVPVSFDYAKKEIYIHSEIFLGDDIPQELIAFKNIFSDVCAKKPQLA